PTALKGAALKFEEDPHSLMGGHFVGTDSFINLPAVLVVLVVTAILVKGIKESAGFNAVMVAIKVAAVLFVILVGAFFIKGAHSGRRGGGGPTPQASPCGGSRGRASRWECWRGRPSSSSPTSASTRCPRTPRRPSGRSATCPSASSSR